VTRSMIGRGAFVGLLATYPFVVYFGIRVLPAGFFAVLLAVIVALRAAVIRAEERKLVLPMMLLLFAYAIIAAIVDRTEALLYYPVLVNITLCAIFILSLRGDESLLLRIARSRGIPMSEYAPGYLRRLTVVWACFFAANAMISFWTTTATLEVWTLYTGLISYMLVGMLILSEWLYRQHYKKRHGVSDG